MAGKQKHLKIFDFMAKVQDKWGPANDSYEDTNAIFLNCLKRALNWYRPEVYITIWYPDIAFYEINIKTNFHCSGVVR